MPTAVTVSSDADTHSVIDLFIAASTSSHWEQIVLNLKNFVESETESENRQKLYFSASLSLQCCQQPLANIYFLSEGSLILNLIHVLQLSLLHVIVIHSLSYEENHYDINQYVT